MYRSLLSLALVMLMSMNLSASSGIKETNSHLIAESYVTALLLTEGKTVQLGFHNFDPNTVLRTSDERLGTATAVSQRDRLGILSFPWRWQLSEEGAQNEFSVGVRASYLEQRGDVLITSAVSEQSPSNDPGSNTGFEPTDQETQEDVSSSFAIGSANLRWRRHLSTHWAVTTSLAAHYLRLNNESDINPRNSPLPSPELVGRVTNYNAHAWIVGPGVGVRRQTGEKRNRLEYFSRFTYLFGNAINPSDTAQDISPEAWYWHNGVEKKHPVFSGAKYPQTIITRFTRVDVGGDLPEPVGSTTFYEFSLGWFSKVADNIPFVNNAGLILNFNYGSDFRGGSLGLLVNVE